MKTRHLLLTLLLALFVPWAAMGQNTLNVYETETDESSYIPLYGYNGDHYQKTEFIIPASELTDMAGNNITSMAFYISSSAPTKVWGPFQVFLKEVEATTLSAWMGTTGATTVYTGDLDGKSGTATMTFNGDSYTYNGGNLLVGIYLTSTTGNWNSASFYGKTVNGASGNGDNDNSLENCTFTQRNFIPRITFTYEMPAAFPSPKNLQISDITAETATASWEAPTSATPTGYEYQYKFAETPSWPDTWNSINDTHKDLVNLFALKTYDFRVRANYAGGDSEPIEKQFTTKATPVAVGDQWNDDFEGESCGWELINGSCADAWAWGIATNNGGTHALYISNDGGETYAYSHDNIKVFAAKLLAFTDGKFTFSYDWLGLGEGSADFLRVALVPASQTLTAGSDYSTIGSSSLPSGWIALDGGGKLNQVTTWQNKEVTVNVTAGNYYLVLAWRSDVSVQNQPPAAVDNVSIVKLACPYDVTGLAVATSPAVTESTATVTWTAGEATGWQVAYSTNSNFEGATQEIVSAASYNMTNLTANTHYYVKVRAYCGGEDYGSWCNAISFYTECPQYTTIPAEGWTINFDDMTGVTSGTTNNLPHCWNYINTSTNSTYKGYPVVYNYQSSSHSGNNHLRFLSYYYSSSSYPADQYAILPAMENVNTLRVKFYARANSTGSSSAVYDATFKVGVMEGTDASTFTEIASYTPESTTYQLYTVPLSSYTGTGTRIAFMIEAAQSGGASYTSYYRSVFIDDITVEEIPSCLEPADLAEVANTATTSTVTFGWTAVNNETTWKVQYKKSDATDWTTVAEPVTTNPYTLPGLDHSSTYQVRVAAWCNPSNPEGISEYSLPITVQTRCEAITSFPWREEFEDYPANTSTGYSETYKFDDPCWLNEHLVDGTGSSGTETWFQVYSGSTANNNTNRLQLPDMKAGTQTELRLPEMTLPGNNYQFTLDVYRDNSSTANEGIRVFASNNGELEGATELAFIPHYYNYEPKESTYGWYTYELPINMSGTCYIIIRGESKYGTATYMDNFVVETIPTCKRPKNPTSTAQTAHTATLSWTNGEEGQDAWQIAYSTSSTFAPADNFTPGEGEGLVDVTTNPATISGLTKSTTYYAYVRANCGSSDLSKWSKAKATFTTKSGNAVPTGLAYDNTSLTSSEVTVNWTGVATNDLHASFELYISTENTTPAAAPEVGDNFITGITASTHHFTALTAETKYYVWVRDNCGDDGLSAWSSSINFTTASACQTPDGLTFSNINSSSFTVDWADHGTVSDWNVRYSSDGGTTWTTIEEATKPCPIDGLIVNTEYRVQVQATCNTEVWSAYATCRTAYSVPFTEEFSSTSIPTNWENKEGLLDNVMTGTALTSGSQWSFGNYNNVFNRHARINIYGGESNSNTRKGWLITPNITLGNNYSLSFDMALTDYSAPSGMSEPAVPETTGTDDKFVVLISTDNEATWTVLRQWDNAGSEYVYNNISLTGEAIYLDLAAYNNQTVRLAFYGESTEVNADNNLHIDNVEVNITTTCYKPQNVTASNETNHSATITWTPGTTEQQAWQLKYNKGADFNPDTEGEAVAVATNPTYTFNKTLDAASEYYVYVRGNCGTATEPDYGPWSKKCTFNTGTSNPAPTTFAKTEVGPDWVDLYWNAPMGDFLSGYGIYYSTTSTAPTAETAAIVTINNPTAPTSAAPYRLTGLENEKTYYLWIRANHEENVYSSWKQLAYPYYITTLPACPIPTSLAAVPAYTTADLTWTGSSAILEGDGYTVQYREPAHYDLDVTEDFSGVTGVSYSATPYYLPEGWKSYNSLSGGYAPRVTDSYSWISVLSGNFLIMTGTYPEQSAYAIMPKYSNISSVEFKYAYENASQGELTVGYVTDNSGYSTYVSLQTPSKTTSKTTFTLSAEDIATINNNNGYIAFCYTRNATSSYYCVGIDDIVIKGGEYHEATAWQDAVTGYTEGFTYQLTGLNVSTKYDVRVYAGCTADPNTENASTSFTTLPFTKTIEAYGNSENGGYYLIASPTMEGITPTIDNGFIPETGNGDYDLYYFDQVATDGKEWVNFKAGNYNIESGKGYLYASENGTTLKFNGTPYTGNFNVNLVYDGNAEFKGWNLLGNPYAVDAYIAGNAYSFYRMNGAGNGFTSVTGEAIHPMEGFFVQATSDGQTLALTTTNPNVQSGPSKLNMNLSSNNKQLDNAIVVFGGNSQALGKFSFREGSSKVYIPMDNKDYAVVNAGKVGEIPVSFKAETNGSYMLSFTSQEVSFSYLHLIDNLTGNDVDLLANPSYSFNAQTTDYASRFRLVFATGSSVDGDNFAFINTMGNLSIFGIEGTATVQVIDLLGRVLSSDTFSGSYEKKLNVAPGVYMIRLINGDDVKVQKIVVR